MGDAPEHEGGDGTAVGVTPEELEAVPLPLDRSIHWIPRKLQLAGRTVSTSCDLFLTANVLREVRDHLASGSGGEVGGLLAGRLFRCPESRRIWARVDSAVKISGPLPEEAVAEEVERAVAALENRIPEKGSRWLGWYHSHALLGVFLSERDVRFHARRFPESWQCALVVLADPEQPGGGVFQPGADGELVRSLYLPFWELRDPEEKPVEGPCPTAMDWENYTTRQPVVPEGMMTEREGGRPREGGSAADERGQWGASEPDGGRSRPEAPGSPYGPRPHPREGGPPGRAGGLPGGRMRRGPSPGDEYPVEVPLVLPGDDGSGFAGLWRRHGAKIAGLLLICLLAAGGWFLWDRIGMPWAGGEAAGTGGEAAVAEVDRSPTAEPPPAAAQFQAALGTFEGAVDSYLERRTDFDLNRLGCDGLTAGYRNVDEAFLRLSELFVRLRDGAGPRPTDRYEGAAQRMEEVDRHFDASGCPRPS